jgi:hypothetical protein
MLYFSRIGSSWGHRAFFGSSWGEKVITPYIFIIIFVSIYFSLCFSHLLSFSLLIDLQNPCIIDYKVFNTCVDLQSYDSTFIERVAE